METQVKNQNQNQNLVQDNNKSQTVISEPPVVAQQPQIQPSVPTNEKKLKLNFLKKIIDLWMKLNPMLRKILMIVGFIFFLLLIVAMVFSFSKKTGVLNQLPEPTALIERSPLPEIIINPSRYATDSSVLSIEEKLKVIERDLNDTVINDLKLSPPDLLWDINFED